MPSKLPTKYWPAEPPATPPGLMLTTMTHLTLFVSPSTARGNRSGHSHCPPVALAGPNSLSAVQSLRLADLYRTTLCSGGFHRGHHPVAAAAGFVVPEHLGVAEVGGVPVQDRVAGVLGPGLAVVEAVGQGLGLQAAVRRGVLVGAGEDRDQRRVLFRAETGRVVLVHDDAAGEDVLLVHRWRSPAAAPSSGQGPWTWRGPRTCSPRCYRRGCAGSTGGRRPCRRRARWGRSSSFFRACSEWPAGTVRPRGLSRPTPAGNLPVPRPASVPRVSVQKRHASCGWSFSSSACFALHRACLR